MRCPECQRNLEPFAISCGQCGWSLAAELEKVPATRSGEKHAAPASDRAADTNFDLLYRSAVEFLEEDEFSSALRTINRAINGATTEQRYDAIAVRGYVHFKLGEFTRAIQDCTEAIQMGWWDARTFAWRAAALAAEQRWTDCFEDLHRAIEMAGSERDRYQQMVANYLPQAEAHFADELRKFPNSSLLLRQIGWVYYRAGILERAEKAYHKCLKIDPREAVGWAGLAAVLIARQEYSQAIVVAHKALIDPAPRTRFSAWTSLAQAHHHLGDVSKKQQALEELARLAEADLNRLLERACLRAELNDPAGSLEDFREILRIAKDFPPAILRRAQTFEQLGNHWLAIADYTHYLRLRPGAQPALLARARAYLGLQDFERANQDATAALQLEPRDVAGYLIRASVLHAKQQLDQALNEVEHAIRIDDRSAPAYHLRGRIEVGLCQFSSAVDDFSRAIEFSERTDSGTRAEYFYSRGTTQYERKEFAAAGDDFLQAARINPNHAGAWIWLAAAQSQLGDLTAAVANLQRAQTVCPEIARQYLSLGRGIADRAVTEFSAILNRNPGDRTAWLGRGLAHQFLGQADQAISDFSQALEFDPDDSETRTRRGQLLQKQKLHFRAIKDFSHVIHREKDNHWARFCRAVSFVAEQKLDHAMSDLHKAIRSCPTQPRYHLLRGEVAARRGQLAKAIRSFSRAELLDPVNPTAARLRGTAQARLGKYPLAIADFTRALELKSDQGDLFALRGQAHLKRGNIDAAKFDFDRAVRLDARQVRAYVGRGEVLAAQGHFHAAVLWLTKSLHRFPTHRELADLLLARGKIFYQMGRYPQAIADFSQVLELVRQNQRGQVTARYGRAIAFLQSGELDAAQRDLEKLLRLNPQHPQARDILKWIGDRNTPRPADIAPPRQTFRLIKPRIVRAPLRLNGSSQTWNIQGPFDNWIVRDRDDQEYGPVSKAILDKWIEQGRIVSGMRILRSDWSKWKRVEKVFPELGD